MKAESQQHAQQSRSQLKELNQTASLLQKEQKLSAEQKQEILKLQQRVGELEYEGQKSKDKLQGQVEKVSLFSQQVQQKEEKLRNQVLQLDKQQMALESAESLKEALEQRHSEKLRELELSQQDRQNDLVMFYTKQLEDKERSLAGGA